MDFKNYLQYAGLTIYNIIMAYFLGQVIFWTLPTPHLPWQISLLPGYIAGAVVSSLLTFLIFKKLRTKRVIKIIVAVVVLVVTICTSCIVITRQSEISMTKINQSMQDK